MNREILFRGKRIDNGAWVEGYVIVYPSGKTEVHKKCTQPPDILLVCETDPETVCQYTGLTDKNGRKIFEGDIAKVQHTDGEEDYVEMAEVSWDDKNACFSPWDWQYQCDGCDLYCEIQSIEVIGNIFDNPELLKGGTE